MGWNIKKTFKKIVRNMDPIRQTKKLTDTIMDKTQDVLDNISGKKAQERMNQANLEAWNMQNEYNTPANQVARLQAAGLNPNLFYSQGNVGNATSAPEVSHSYDKMKYLDFAMSVAQLSNIIGQNENLKAQKAATEANTAYRNVVLGSINKYGMPPNILTGLFSMMENAGFSPQQMFTNGMKLISSLGAGLGFVGGNAAGFFENMFYPSAHPAVKYKPEYYDKPKYNEDQDYLYGDGRYK